MTAKRKVPKKNTVLQLRRGNPGNRGGSGRPSLAYQERCRWLAEQIVNGAALKIVKDHEHPQLIALLRHVDERGFGKVTQPIRLTVEERLKRMEEILEEAERDAE